MNSFDQLKRLDRVSAPEGFEDGVLKALASRRRQLPALRRARAFRRAMAVSAVVLLAGLGALNLFVLRGPAPSATMADADSGQKPLSITEPVDYRGDLQNASYAPGAVYILERVSEASPTLIKY
ncbi:MAG: hypothetical protein NTZ26_14910 [Candidatus Aminicenantes bacterium]|nr:hypothetical protein [Candidatus Aminicenantes bacterium]